MAASYRVGRSEVTNSQYTEFLNAVAATDTHGLYNANMGTSPYGGISRGGSSGSFSYSAIAGREQNPVNFVSFYDALRFANWLHNGQLVGAQHNATTEDGAYTITPQGVSNNSITRNAGATIFLPSEDEWYKAAYHTTLVSGIDHFFDYPAGFDAQTTCSASTSIPNSANCAGQAGNDLTPVGSYTGSTSPHGTFDQGGNVFEWNEAVVSGSFRGIRGGSFSSIPSQLAASARFSAHPTSDDDNLGIGFRVASVPEPGTGPLLMLGMLIASWRRRRRPTVRRAALRKSNNEDPGRIETSCRLGLAVAVSLTLLAGSTARAEERVELTYATMRDGVQLALAVTYPRDYDEARQYPALFAMSGYKWSVYPLGESRDYFMVHASMRGTGCSGGEFHLFGESVGYDGYDAIESWIVRQPWSNGRVGITGHSFWGLVGFQVAATNPPHAVAAGVSGLIDDFYRGIVYTGGVLNYGFPVAWGLARHQADSEQEAWAYRGQDEFDRGDPTCAENIAEHAVVYPFLPLAFATAYDGPFWQEHALEQIASRVRIPIHLRQQYQDEQTGPGGYRLWEAISDDTPKRIVFSNGEHDGPTGQSDRGAWLRCWVIDRGEGCPGGLLDPGARVQVHFDTVGPSNDATIHAAVEAADYPLPDTDWITRHLRADGALTIEPGSGESSTFETVTAGDTRTSSGLHPTALTFEMPFDAPTAFFGPSAVTLDAVVEGAEADIFVEIADRWPDGRLEFLQRGMLRASHAAVDEMRSGVVASGPSAGTVYRPWHPHTPETSVVPALPPTPLRIEVPAWGHVFQPGHRLVLRVSSPPAQDRVGGTYSYASPLPSANVAIRHGGGSTLLLAQRPALPEHAPGRVCGELWGIPCHQEPPANAERFEGAGCIATPAVAPTCSFVATGPHTYVGEAVNELVVRVYRDSELVYEVRKGGGLGSPNGNLPWTGTVPSVAGDIVEGEIVPGCAGPACGEAGTLVVGNPAAG